MWNRYRDELGTAADSLAVPVAMVLEFPELFRERQRLQMSKRPVVVKGSATRMMTWKATTQIS